MKNQFGEFLKVWRKKRGLSQLGLSFVSETSQRHISFLESGRSTPSKTMVINLCDALDVPLDETNKMLLLAGFAPSYSNFTLDHPQLAPIRKALQFMLESHLPYPALLVDNLYNVIDANAAAIRFQLFLYDLDAPEALPEHSKNLLAGVFHPEGYGKYIENHEQVTSTLFSRLVKEVHYAGNPQEGLDLINRLRSYCPAIDVELPDVESLPILQTRLVKGDVALNLVTTIASFGSPFDVTVDKLKIETFLPYDRPTEVFFRQWDHELPG